MKGLARSLRKDVIKIPFTTTMDLVGDGVSDSFGGVVIGKLPEGNLLFLGAVAYATVDATGQANVTNNWAGDFTIGTIGYGESGEYDSIVDNTVLTAGASDKITPRTRGAVNANDQMRILDNTDGNLDLYFNMLVSNGYITPTETGTFTIDGVLYAAYVTLGDD